MPKNPGTPKLTYLDMRITHRPVADSPSLGPAMAAITPQQRAFVLAYVEHGSKNAAAAARASGYGSQSPTETQGQEAAKTAGWRLMHDAKILAAIRELAQARIGSLAFLAADVLLEVANDPTHKDRLKAADMLMNRAGMLVVSEQKVTVEHKIEKRDDILKRIENLAAKHGLDSQKLLAGRVQDAEFVEIETLTPEAEPAMSADGLEDLL